MIKRILQKRHALSDILIDKSVSQRNLAVFFIIVLLLSLIPLFLVALYNYPADDDFSHTHTSVVAWANTHSLKEVFHSASEHVRDTYDSWNGDFTQFIITVSTPMIFGIQYYFLSNWFVLLSICLSIGYGLKGLMMNILRTSRAAFYLAYTIILSMVLQFMPSIAEGIYWHAGSPYVITWCFIPVIIGLLIKLRNPQSAFRRSYRILLLIVLAILSGGGTYPVAISTFVLLAFITGSALFSKWKNRKYVILAFVAFLAGLIISLISPGNTIRQEWLGETHSVFWTLTTAILDSCDLIGQWFSLIVIAALMLLVPLLWKPMKDSTYQFRHPFLVVLGLFAVFSSTLSPGIFTNFGYTAARYINPVYFNFLLFVFGSIIYFQGAFIRLLEQKKEGTAAGKLLEATQNIGQRFGMLYLVACLIVLLFGSFGNTIMNTASISATKSLVTGEAATFRREMAERQEYIRITDSDVVAVKPLHAKPYVFKEDKLPFQGIYGPVRYMKWHFELQYDPDPKQ